MSVVRIDPKRFEDADFTLQYFQNTSFDPNEMNRQLIQDQVQVNLLVVLGCALKALQGEKNKATDSKASDMKSDVDMINQQREANQKAQENAPVNSEIQTAQTVSTNPANLGTTNQDTTLTKGDVANSTTSSSDATNSDTKAPTSASQIDL